MLGNVYEGLTPRRQSEDHPGLAERWETPEPTRWRFYLRKDVKFAGGEPFTAEDVIFSFDRVRQNESEFKTRVPMDARIVKIDDYTIDFVLTQPSPNLIGEWDSWYILSKAWCGPMARRACSQPPARSSQRLCAEIERHRPYVITSHEPGVKTTMKKNAAWWGWKDAPGNVDDVVFTTIKQDATRVAALLSGEVDMIEAGSGSGHDARRRQCRHADAGRTGIAHDPSLHGPEARRTEICLGEGQEPVQGRARPQGLL